jgi:hypothetical protein
MLDKDNTHECPKDGCLRRVRRSQLACATHWQLVSKPTQREVYAAYRSGNLGRHVAAMQDAVDEMNRAAPTHGPDAECADCHECAGCGGADGSTPKRGEVRVSQGVARMVCLDCEGAGVLCPNYVAPGG